MFYGTFPLKGSTYAQLGKSLSKGYNLWEVREAGERKSKKSLGNIQLPVRPSIGNCTCQGICYQWTWKKNMKGKKGQDSHTHTHTHTQF
jgi:hypothetical protein